ncbi:MAG: hypothetical protein AAGB22_11310, partial [Bacteroidota bacterium]
TVTVSVLNLGTDTVTSIPVCFSVDAGAQQCQTFSVTLLPDSTADLTFTATADLSVIGPHTIQVITGVAGDAVPCNDTANFSVETLPVITSFPYEENFENGPGSWIAGGQNSSWEYGMPDTANAFINTSGACGDSAWVTNLDGDYNNSENSFLESPIFDFSGLGTDPVIRFEGIFQTESCCDEGFVEISLDGGATYSTLGMAGTGLNWYNDAGNNWYDGVSGNPGQWLTASNVLTGAAGNSAVKIRFRVSTDGSVSEEGFGVDNIVISDTIIEAYVTAINTPVSACGLTATETVSVDIYNTSLDTLVSVPVCFIADNGTPVCETVSVSIATGDTQTVTLANTVDFSAGGPHTLDVYAMTGLTIFSCNDTASTVVNNSVFNAEVIVQNNVFCNGGMDGQASVNVVAGTMPYAYIWQAGDTAAAVNNLPAGIFAVTVSDANGCSSILTDTITEPTAVGITVIDTTSITCNGANDGSAEVFGSGGTPGYTYQWSTGATGTQV